MITIQLPSRYKDINSSLIQCEDKLTFDLKSDSNYVRVIFNTNPNEIQSIDLEGGPFMSVGDTNIFEGHTLKQIVEEKEQFKFIFEKNEDKG